MASNNKVDQTSPTKEYAASECKSKTKCVLSEWQSQVASTQGEIRLYDGVCGWAVEILYTFMLAKYKLPFEILDKAPRSITDGLKTIVKQGLLSLGPD